jgi:hypothetical protein
MTGDRSQADKARAPRLPTRLDIHIIAANC